MKAIHAVRLDHLKQLIESRFEGNAGRAAKALNRSHTFIWQLVNKKRAIGEDTARHIEQSLGLAWGALDQDSTGALRQATQLTVIRDDGTQQTFRMVPEVEFTAGLNKKKRGAFCPCPIECSGGTVAVKVLTDSLQPHFRAGDDVFIDKEQREIVDNKVYAIQIEGESEPRLRIAKHREGGGWEWFASGSPMIEHTKKIVVLGRAIYQGHKLNHD